MAKTMEFYRQMAEMDIMCALIAEQGECQAKLESNKRLIDTLDGHMREQLQNSIKRIGNAIGANRAGSNNHEVEFALVACVKQANNTRHNNRENVKQLAEEQKILKGRLDVIGRLISSLTP